jgi:acetyl esterase/lipase
MQRVGWRCFAAALALFAGGVLAQQAASSASGGAPPSAELFYRLPDIESAALSPSGRWLAVTTGTGHTRTMLAVFDTATLQPLGVVAKYANADVHRFQWVNEEYLVYDLIDRLSGSGDQRWWPGLISVTRDGRQKRQLINNQRNFFTTGVRPGVEPLAYNHELLHVPAGGGEEVVVGEWVSNGVGELQGVYPKRLNVVTGRPSSLAFGAPAHAREWIFSPDGQPRAVVTRHRDSTAVHWRAPRQDEWRELVRGRLYQLPFTPRFVDSEGRLYVSSTDRDGFSVLRRFDFEQGRPEQEPLVSTPGFDFSGSIVSESPGSRALGVRVNTDAESTVWFDPRLKALQQEADTRLPGRVNRLDCRRCDEPDMTVLVRSFSDADPGTIWLYTATDKQWRRLGSVRIGVHPARMASTDFERVKARDGLEFPLWVTRPAGSKGPLPTVVLVHGGPWVRGRNWSWNPDAQFLASRGYLVLEPEFRGSRGFGGKLFRAGWRQWGRAMQDDVADALAWSVAQGHSDPKRVCIAGASYGGYATLMGLIRHPELYRCGVAWVAVTDPRLLFQWRSGTDQSDDVREVHLPLLIGDPVADAAMIDSVTPVLRAGEIKSPLLLGVGGSDRRVLPVHAERLQKALADAGRPAEVVRYEDEGHNWLQLKTRVDFAQRLETFLARHLGP